MNLKMMARKCRQIADAIDELFNDVDAPLRSNENAETASALRESMRKRKSYVRTKLHWTQTPKGRRHMAKLGRQRAAAKKRFAAEQRRAAKQD